MKAIVNTAPGQLALQDLPLPRLQVGEVLIRTGACGICATDIKMIAGWDRTGYPSIPGHEWSGTVAAVGPGVDAALLGCRCVAENVLSDGGEVGFEYPGGYGEYFVTAARNVYALPEDFPLTLAALIEPLAVAVHGTQRLRIEDSSRALVLGDGAVGLLFVAVLRAAGVREIFVAGGRPSRCQLAQDLGAAKIVNYHEAGTDLVGAIQRMGGGTWPNIIEASGSVNALRAAVEMVAHGGHIVVVGDQGEAHADFPWNTLLHREMELIGSNASAGAWPETVKLATSGKLPLERFVSHRFPVEEFEQAIELTRQRRGDVIKVVLEWESTKTGQV